MASPRADAPEDVDRLFAECLNAGDVAGVVALYEPGATLVRPGGAAVESGTIEASVRSWVDNELTLQCNVIAVHGSGDTRVLYNDWRGTRRGPCGELLNIAGKALEVVRRQPDGSWLFLIDDPFGRS
jgi:ketosteroid isomerase-like protein